MQEDRVSKPLFPRWRVIECSIYGLIVLVLIVTLVPEFSRYLTAQCRQNRECSRHMRPGWLGQVYVVDSADNQWRDFRAGLPTLLVVSTVKICITQLMYAVINRKGQQGGEEWRFGLEAAFSMIFLWTLHGPGCLLLAATALGLFQAGRALGGRTAAPAAPALAWGAGLALLWAKGRAPGALTFRGLLGERFVGGAILCTYTQIELGSYKRFAGLDKGGMYPWRFSLPLLMLRIISLNTDYYWSCCAALGSDSQEQASAISQKKRSNDMKQLSSSEERAYRAARRGPRAPGEYTAAAAAAYLLYAPLHVAGPLLPANAFLAQVRERGRYPRPPAGGALRYLARALLALGLLEALAAACPVWAAQRAGLAGRMPPWRVGEYLYMTITMIWLKFLVIWRIARAWALLEGIVPPENMTRCISNTYSLTVFWRGWHASFNQWLVRYLYVPLGGGRRRVLNGLLTFLFVAYWHDLEWKLLVWGLLNGGFLAMEAAAAAFYRSERWQWFIKKPYFSHLAAFCIGVYLILVIIGNLVGYHVGVNGSVDIVKQLFFSVAGWAFLGVASAVVGAVVRLMFFLEDLKAAWGGGKTC